MQAVFALAFLAVANAAIIDPSIYYKPEAKIYNPYYKPEAKIYNPYYSQYMQNDYPYNIEHLNDAVISAPVAESVLSTATPAFAPVSFAKTAAFPWSNIYSKAAPAIPSNIALESAFAPALKSGLAYAIPAVKSSAYHLVKADFPYFTAAPTSSYVEAAAPVVTAEEYAARGLLPAISSISSASAFPAFSSALPASLAAAEPALMKAFSPALVNAAAPFIASSVAAPSLPLFKSAAFPWGLVSSAAAPSAAAISLMKSAPLLGAESAFAPAVHAIDAAPIHLVKSAPASFVSGLYSAENALTTPYSLVKAISPASGLFEEPAISFAPHIHAYAPALKAAFPSVMPALTAFAPAAFANSIASPASGFGYLAESPALKAWIK